MFLKIKKKNKLMKIKMKMNILNKIKIYPQNKINVSFYTVILR